MEAVNKPPVGFEHDQGTKRVMAQKAPFAFEWHENIGWDAQARLDQRISLEKNKDPNIWETPPGAAARAVSADIVKLNEIKWTKKDAEDIFTRIMEKNKRRFSEREMTIYRWMVFHLYLGGTPTSNPHKEDVFGYFHEATSPSVSSCITR